MCNHFTQPATINWGDGKEDDDDSVSEELSQMDDPRRGNPDNKDDDNEDVHISLGEFALNSPIPYGAMKDLRRRLARFIWEHAGVEDEEGCESVDNDMFFDDSSGCTS